MAGWICSNPSASRSTNRPSTTASYPLKHPSVTTPESRILPVFQFTVPYSSATSEPSPGAPAGTIQRVLTCQIGFAVSIRAAERLERHDEAAADGAAYAA